MATVRHLEIMKFCIFVTWRLSERGSFFLPNFALIGQSIARVIAKKRSSIWQPSAILSLLNFDALSCDRRLKQNFLLHTKFHCNRMIPA